MSHAPAGGDTSIPVLGAAGPPAAAVPAMLPRNSPSSGAAVPSPHSGTRHWKELTPSDAACTPECCTAGWCLSPERSPFPAPHRGTLGKQQRLSLGLANDSPCSSYLASSNFKSHGDYTVQRFITYKTAKASFKHFHHWLQQIIKEEPATLLQYYNSIFNIRPRGWITWEIQGRSLCNVTCSQLQF